MPIIKIRENETVDIALRRFRRSCEKAGILAEVRRRERYEKPAEARKRKNSLARKRNRKNRSQVLAVRKPWSFSTRPKTQGFRG